MVVRSVCACACGGRPDSVLGQSWRCKDGVLSPWNKQCRPERRPEEIILLTWLVIARPKAAARSRCAAETPRCANETIEWTSLSCLRLMDVMESPRRQNHIKTRTLPRKKILTPCIAPFNAPRLSIVVDDIGGGALEGAMRGVRIFLRGSVGAQSTCSRRRLRPLPRRRPRVRPRPRLLFVGAKGRAAVHAILYQRRLEAAAEQFFPCRLPSRCPRTPIHVGSWFLFTQDPTPGAPKSCKTQGICSPRLSLVVFPVQTRPGSGGRKSCKLQGVCCPPVSRVLFPI